MHEAVVIDSRN